MIGSFLYVMATRPDVMQAIGLVAGFQSALKETQLTTGKIIPRYLKGTIEHGLWNPRGQDFTLKVFTHADWEGSVQ